MSKISSTIWIATMSSSRTRSERGAGTKRGRRVREANDSPAGRWWRFSVGIVLLVGFIALLATLPPPAEVLRHNTEHDIQATALFYMDLERMPEIERQLEVLQEEASQKP